MLTCAWSVLLMCGPIFCEPPSGVMPHLYFSRDLEETEKEEQNTPEKAETMVEFQGEWTPLVPMFIAAQINRGKLIQGGCTCPARLSSIFLWNTEVSNQTLRTGRQLPLNRPLSGLEPPMSGTELL